jgi:DNA processing protein
VSSRSREQVAAATLLCLPQMDPQWLEALVEHFGSWTAALDAVCHRRAAATLAARNAEAQARRRRDPRALAARWQRAIRESAVPATLEARDTHVLALGDPDYPIAEALPRRPPVLLAEGAAPEVLTRPRVAVVGTRAASPSGLEDARELGRVLATAGTTVVSGLAIGIDAAAHEGALSGGGGVVGVVATGLDVVYPRRHATLFERVRRAGLIIGETAFGVQPERWRFPVRNRIIAALADVVVIVEATLHGGSRITAEYALEYGRAVLAMPGSRRNPSAAGCNTLLADGAHPLLDPSDVLLALGLTGGGSRGWFPAAERPPPTGTAATVLRACHGEAAHPDELVARTGVDARTVAAALVELERAGWLRRAGACYWPLSTTP